VCVAWRNPTVAEQDDSRRTSQSPLTGAASVRAAQSLASGAVLLDILRTVGAYIRGQLLVALILSGLYAVGFGLAGVPAWPLVAPVCGLLNLLPVFGVPSAMLLALGLTLADTGDFVRVLMVAGIFVVVLTLEGYFLTPRIVGHRVGVRPLYVFLAGLLGGALFGFLGLLLAVPAVAVANVVWRHLSNSRRARV
jgi:predicted PurR-regulated permease PerM